MLMVLISTFFLVFLNWTVLMNFISFFCLGVILQLYDEGLYNLSLIMILLSFWLLMLMFNSVEMLEESFALKCMFMLIMLMLEVVFYSNSMFMFYLGFEASVIPLLIVILGWGLQPDRLEAGFFMILYTVFFSLPLLIGIFMYEVYFYSYKIMVVFFILAFLVKFPLFGLHLWLPRAHVEAPAYGSMILAGIMLKLGGFGMIKLIFSMGDLIYISCEWLIIYSMIGGVVISFICFLQSDLKVLIAYSSVVHMSVTLSGILTFHESGLLGAVFMMIGHGLCSSGLFCLLGIFYSRTKSRSIFINKGLITVVPSSILWWFIFCMGNLSFPPSLNLIGEVFLFLSLASWSFDVVVLIMMFSFFSSLYSVFMFLFTYHGSMKKSYSFNSFTLKESLMMFLHFIPLNFLILDLKFIFY